MAARDPYARFGLSISGHAYAPNASRQVSARLVTRAALPSEGTGTDDVIIDLLNSDGVVLTGAPLSEITVDPPIGSVARRLHFPDHVLFETEDRAGIATLTGTTFGEALNYYEAFHPRLIAVCLVAAFAAFAIWRWGLDMLVTVAIALTPPVFIDQLDKGTLQTIDFTMRAMETRLDQSEQDRVTRIFSNLLAELPAEHVNDHDFKLLFRNMAAVGPNAFALPGGTVVMTDQFVKEFPGDDTLAAVLGHEIGHVVEEHGLRRTYRSLGLYFVIGFIAGDTGPILEEILLEGNLLLSLSFSREQEAAADRFGVKLTDRAGYDAAGLKLFFENMSKRGIEPPQWLSTHPNSQKRVEQIEGYIEELR
ncbi:MAG: M48 family metallopeptidase [Pseudomonadota bacterium]